MLRYGWRATLDYGLAGQGVVFDPATLTVVTLASTAVGGAMSAASTIAGGSYAKTAGQMTKSGDYSTADQLDQNASQALASNQRKMFDTQLKTRLTQSTANANAGASGVDASVGSPVENQGQLAARGSYQALTDMFNGESTASGLRNQAAAKRFEGDMAEDEGAAKESASWLSALGTLAGTAGSMGSSYKKMS